MHIGTAIRNIPLCLALFSLFYNPLDRSKHNRQCRPSNIITIQSTPPTLYKAIFAIKFRITGMASLFFVATVELLLLRQHPSLLCMDDMLDIKYSIMYQPNSLDMKLYLLYVILPFFSLYYATISI